MDVLQGVSTTLVGEEEEDDTETVDPYLLVHRFRSIHDAAVYAGLISPLDHRVRASEVCSE